MRFRIDKAELLDQESLLHHLRGIKRSLAEQFGDPDGCMVFEGILNKEATDVFVDVVVRIKKCTHEKGDPQIHFKEGVAQDGTRHAKMRALLDLYYLDADETPVRMEKILRAISQANLEPDLVHLDTVAQKLHEVRDLKSAIKEIEIAVGRFSDVGKDAEIEFLFEACTDISKLNAYFSSRKVKKGDTLCRVKPPTYGQHQGKNVIGQAIPPREGQGIELEAGAGVMLTGNKTEAIAKEDGIVVVAREMRQYKTSYGAKELPSKVTLKVNPVLQVDGDQLLDIETNKSVEVIGNLRMGSRILTNCGVHITGDVENGTLVAGDDIVIDGNMRDSTISSDTNVVLRGIIADCDLNAKELLMVEGDVKHSKLSGANVTAGAVSNSEIVAARNVTLQSVAQGNDEQPMKILTGMHEFYKQRILENERFLLLAKEKLDRIEQIIGKDIMTQITSTNLQNMLLKILVRNQVGRDLKSKRQAAVFRKLLESIPAIREMMAWKMEENENLRERLRHTEGDESSRVVIKEKVGSPTIVSIHGVETEIPVWDGPVEIFPDGPDDVRVEHR